MAPALGHPARRSRTSRSSGGSAPDATLERANAELAARVLPARGSRGPRAGLARPLREHRHRQRRADDHRRADGRDDACCCSSRASTSPTCCWRAAPAGGARSRCAPRSARAAAASSGSCSPSRCCSRWRPRSSRCRSPGTASAGCTTRCRRPNRSGPYYVDWSLDRADVAYALAIALVTGLAFGLAPAFDATGRRLLNPLREGAGAASRRRQRRVHSALIVAQIALALVLLAGASLFVRTYVSLQPRRAGLRHVAPDDDAVSISPARRTTGRRARRAPSTRSPRAWRRCPARTRRPSPIWCRSTIKAARMRRPRSKGARSRKGRSRRSTTPAWLADGRRPSICGSSPAGRSTTTSSRRRARRARQREAGRTTFWPGADPLGRRFRLAEDDVESLALGDRRRAGHPHRQARRESTRRRRPRTCRTGSSPRATTASSIRTRGAAGVGRPRTCARRCTPSIRRSRCSTSIRWSRCAG